MLFHGGRLAPNCFQREAIGAKRLERQLEHEQFIAVPGALAFFDPQRATEHLAQGVGPVGQTQAIDRQAQRDGLLMRADIEHPQQLFRFVQPQHGEDLLAVARDGVVQYAAMAERGVALARPQQPGKECPLAVFLLGPDHGHEPAEDHPGQQHPADPRPAQPDREWIDHPGPMAFDEADAHRAGRQRQDVVGQPFAQFCGCDPAEGHVHKHMVG